MFPNSFLFMRKPSLDAQEMKSILLFDDIGIVVQFVFTLTKQQYMVMYTYTY